MLNLSPQDLLRGILAALVGFTVHEFAHAWVALRLGDTTAREEGRVTLNPFRHIDIFGFVLLVVAGFGWGKPVTVDRSRLRHPVRDDIAISLAGPFANLLLAACLAVLFKVLVSLMVLRSPTAWTAASSLFEALILVNLGLGLFNLLPLPPLDGHRPVAYLLARADPAAAAFYLKYGPILLFAWIALEWFAGIDVLPIAAAVRGTARAMFRALALI
jgi:Zn-dependent protease